MRGTFGHYRYRFPIHEPLARAVVEQGVERGFDLFYTQHAPLDYAFYVPLHFTMPEPAVPIVPLHVNVYLPPQPTRVAATSGAGRSARYSDRGRSEWP